MVTPTSLKGAGCAVAVPVVTARANNTATHIFVMIRSPLRWMAEVQPPRLLHRRQLREELSSGAVGRYEALYPLAVLDLARIDIALCINGNHVEAIPLAAVVAHAAHAVEHFAVGAVEEP